MNAKDEKWACVLINGKEWTAHASIVNWSDTVDEAIEKSNKLEKEGIKTIVREI